MRFTAALSVLVLSTAAFTQNAPRLASQVEPESVTVPITLDHNRVLIDVGLPLPDGSTRKVRGWVSGKRWPMLLTIWSAGSM